MGEFVTISAADTILPMFMSTRSLFCLLISALCTLGLNSCLWTRVSTHTIADSVGKEEYVAQDIKQQAEIYSRNGVYYLQHVFYKAPARGELYRFMIAAKTASVEHVYLSDKIEYREGMEKVYLYSALDKRTLEKLLPNECYKEHAEGEWVLPQSSFEGAKPVAVIRDRQKLCHLYGLDASAYLPSERSAANYAMMPLTGALYVTDIPLTIGVTTAGWLGVNVPLVIYALFDLAVESFK